jgi:flagellar basal-body rod modification protein FlgD
MTTVTDPLADLRVRSQVAQRQQLGQEDFLKLMVTQLRNQDPFKPMENGEFLGQIAQFSTVSGIQGLQDMFGALSASLQSDQALQAAGLVGRTALVNAGQARLAAGGSVDGAVELPAGAADVTVEIRDAGGTVVRTLPLGTQGAGFAAFALDGRDASGAPLPEGSYRISARGRVGGRTESLNTLVAARIESVSLGGAGGLALNLANLGPVAFASVRQFQ